MSAKCAYCGTYGALGRCASCGAPNEPAGAILALSEAQRLRLADAWNTQAGSMVGQPVILIGDGLRCERIPARQPDTVWK